jgi:hypothetical protein
MENNPKSSDVFPLSAETKRLQVFLGDWTVEGTLTFEGEPLKVKGLS